jgi:hypothetical protein
MQLRRLQVFDHLFLTTVSLKFLEIVLILSVGEWFFYDLDIVLLALSFYNQFLATQKLYPVLLYLLLAFIRQ